MKKTKFLLAVLVWAFFPLFLSGCYIVPAGTVYEGGPPPHAPAHGYRKYHSYRYYPEAQVYYSLERRAYFYYDHAGWRMSVTLPYELRLRLGDHVIIEMDSDRPYRDFDKHRNRYPSAKYKFKHRR